MEEKGEGWVRREGGVGSTRKSEMNSSDARPTTPPMPQEEPVCPWAPYRPTFGRRDVNEAQGVAVRSLYNNEE